MKAHHAQAHMRSAYNYANLSHCVKHKVGCIVVSADKERIISIGWNGTAPGEDNTCELPDGTTKPDVYHAEENAIGKLAGSTESAVDGYVFVTLQPCVVCARLISLARVKRVYYDQPYKNDLGTDHLRKRNIEVVHLSLKK